MVLQILFIHQQNRLAAGISLRFRAFDVAGEDPGIILGHQQQQDDGPARIRRSVELLQLPAAIAQSEIDVDQAFVE